MSRRLDQDLGELSSILWVERHLLEQLCFRLETLQVLRGTDTTRWLTWAVLDVQVVLEQIRAIELLRAVQVQVVVDATLLSPLAGLSDLACSMPGPWAQIFASHRAALVDMAEANEAVPPDADVIFQTSLIQPSLVLFLL